MKTMQRTLSVLLCCILLAAFAPMAYAADTLIAQAGAIYVVPAAGEAIDFDSVTVPDNASYTARISAVNYLDAQSKVPVSVKNGDVVTAGVTYNVYVVFEAKAGYKFDENETEFYVNGEKAAVIYAFCVRSVFTAQGEEPTDPTPSKPTFRDRVATFFRDMYNRIWFVFYVIRSIFGKKM